MNIAANSLHPPVALIAGPTASGKSALAMALAEAANGVVINADASQCYADLRILTARPMPADEARVPHRLFGTRDAADPASAAAWAADARGAITEAHGRGQLPILVGGSGLYLRTLLDGIAPVPEIDPAIRAVVRALPVTQAHAALAIEDAAAAARLHPADTTRVARALEVVRSTGRPLAAWQAARAGGIANDIALHPFVLTPPRDILRARCDARFLTMLEDGAVDEVERLRACSLDPTLPVMRAIGVREIGAWLDGVIDRATMIVQAQAATRQYAKRQTTWFANQAVAWPALETQLSDDEIADMVTKMR